MTRFYHFLRPLYAPLLNRWKRTRARQIWESRKRTEIQKIRSGNTPLKVIIGAGNTSFEEWVATDLPFLDITNRSHWGRIFQPASIDRILAEHVMEHLYEAQFREFLRVVRPYLSASGVIRIAVPDGNHPDPAYIHHVIPGSPDPDASDHKILYTYDLMQRIVSEEGYRCALLEYFDENGKFHAQAWSSQDGHIHRSQGHDPRNQSGNPTAYTSLIVDCALHQN